MSGARHGSAAGQAQALQFSIVDALRRVELLCESASYYLDQLEGVQIDREAMRDFFELIAQQTQRAQADAHSEAEGGQ